VSLSPPLFSPALLQAQVPKTQTIPGFAKPTTCRFGQSSIVSKKKREVPESTPPLIKKQGKKTKKKEEENRPVSFAP